VIPANSGTTDERILFTNYNKETVTISGTEVVTGWTQVDGNLWYAPFPGDYVSANNQSDQVFLDGKMLNLARWPQEKNNDLSRPYQATIDSIVSSVPTGENAPGPQYPIYRTTFYDADFNEPDGRWVGAKIWVNSGNIHVSSDDDERDGNGQTGVVIETNRSNRTITVDLDAPAASGTERLGNFQIGIGNRYYLFDPQTVDGLQNENEFWHDAVNNLLYIRTVVSPASQNI
jgi:hypothetical protein